MATIYAKNINFRDLDYTIEVESNIETDPYLLHLVTVKDDTNAVVWSFNTFDDAVETSVDAAEKYIYREINKRLDGEDYMLNRMTNLGFS